MRVGFGFDAHRFADGRRLVLGGVEIDWPMGLQGHSDADVVIHAIADALLGAAGLGDIGGLFPDTDERFKDIDSRHLLREVRLLIDDSDYRVSNVDVTIVAEEPKLSPHFRQMRENLAADLCILSDAVNVKATTTEGMGFAGRKEGIAAYAVASLTGSV